MEVVPLVGETPPAPRDGWCAGLQVAASTSWTATDPSGTAGAPSVVPATRPSAKHAAAIADRTRPPDGLPRFDIGSAPSAGPGPPDRERAAVCISPIGVRTHPEVTWHDVTRHDAAMRLVVGSGAEVKHPGRSDVRRS